MVEEIDHSSIIKGQKAFGTLSDGTESGMTANAELDPVDVNGGSRLVGWVDQI